METAEYDLIVAGAGPAGSACAITAARAGVRVLLLEKDRFPRHKVCGEFVSSESLDLLRGLLGKKTLSPHILVRSARFFVDHKRLRLPVSPAAQCVPRYELDAALFRAAQEAGATTREGTTIQEVRRAGGFAVVTAENSFSAKAVVNATGRWSKLRQFEVAGKERWLGLKAHFREPSPSPSVDLYFFPGGYCGVTPVDADTINACAMVRADLARSLEEVFAQQPELRSRSRAWQPLFAAVTTSPLYFREPETEAGGMMLAGDAAGFIDPFAGDGISLALQSGTLAAETIVPFLAGKYSWEDALHEYRSAYQKRFAPAFRNAARLRSALAAPKWLRNTALTLANMPGIGKMLVRGTRARGR
ncbi:MAG TPA: NAD(P)/FAD-dependent oxidoreductase [Candidatus Angelobacter sp.]|nr:NAD(P)/FAD-dependent oxidoreductase [Candidatus Angelobacter sp.]